MLFSWSDYKMTKDKMKVWLSIEISDSLACYIEKQLKQPRGTCFLSFEGEIAKIDTIELIEYNTLVTDNIKHSVVISNVPERDE